MALANSFANQITDLPSQLDTNFGQVGAMMVTTCTATGNNAISLTPAGGQPPVTAYKNYLQFSFIAAGDSTNIVSVQVGSLALQPLYLQDGTTQATKGNIKGGTLYVIVYNTALNGGLGGFQLWSQQPISSLLDVLGSSQGTVLTRGASAWMGLSAGANGNLLQSQGNSLVWTNPGLKKSKQLIFQNTGSFSFSSSSGIASSTVVKITLVGAGGGGGGGVSGKTITSGAGGGGAGAIAIGFISGLSANTLYSGSVGIGGQGGTGGGLGPNQDVGQPGTAGGTTTISFGGVQFTAGGGGGGLGAQGGNGTRSAIAAGSGGVATNATILITGGKGCPGGLLGTNGMVAGQGGRGFWGGSAAVFNGFISSQGANSPGAGGSGGASLTDKSGNGLAGKNGVNGIFIMEWIE